LTHEQRLIYLKIDGMTGYGKSMTFKNISVVGLGYIGLPTATLFANSGLAVHGVDINQKAIDLINRGRAHFGEPNLDDMLSAVVAAGRLKASRAPEPADAFILAVPTPFKGDHEPDLKYVEAAAKSIATVLRSGNLIILESTSPVGTTELVREWCAAARPDLKFAGDGIASPDVHLAYCPERVLPGRILEELVSNARVIGGLTPACAEMALKLYRTIVKGECKVTNARTAEMAKLSENAFRDVNIAFANELSVICDNLNINVWELIGITNLHPRVQILEPGPGVGGHCIAVDPWFIVSRSPQDARLIRAARNVNDSKPHYVVAKIEKAALDLKAKPTIACFGLSYKPDVDDLRESPSIEIVEQLAKKGFCTVIVVEPHTDSLPASLASLGVELVNTNEAIRRADILAFLVDHKEFRGLDAASFGNKTVLDPRGIWSRTTNAFAT
jgi:UDP-N-acetyl-D-mannosaminuronic acid dehydrogenase